MSSRRSQGHIELSKYADLKLILKLGMNAVTQTDLDKFGAWVLGKKIRDYLLRQHDTKIILPALVSD